MALLRCCLLTKQQLAGSGFRVQISRIEGSPPIHPIHRLPKFPSHFDIRPNLQMSRTASRWLLRLDVIRFVLCLHTLQLFDVNALTLSTLSTLQLF